MILKATYGYKSQVLTAPVHLHFPKAMNLCLGHNKVVKMCIWGGGGLLGEKMTREVFQNIFPLWISDMKLLQHGEYDEEPQVQGPHLPQRFSVWSPSRLHVRLSYETLPWECWTPSGGFSSVRVTKVG